MSRKRHSVCVKFWFSQTINYDNLWNLMVHGGKHERLSEPNSRVNQVLGLVWKAFDIANTFLHISC
jgi:hypothetical protein